MRWLCCSDGLRHHRGAANAQRQPQPHAAGACRPSASPPSPLPPRVATRGPPTASARPRARVRLMFFGGAPVRSSHTPRPAAELSQARALIFRASWIVVRRIRLSFARSILPSRSVCNTKSAAAPTTPASQWRHREHAIVTIATAFGRNKICDRQKRFHDARQGQHTTKSSSLP